MLNTLTGDLAICFYGRSLVKGLISECRFPGGGLLKLFPEYEEELVATVDD